MQPFFHELFDRFKAIHRSIRIAMEELPVEALDWAPGPETNSIGVLVAHTSGSERFWIGDVAMGEGSNRDRAAEFRTRRMDAGQLLELLDSVESYILGAFERLRMEDLEAERPGPRAGEKCLVAWALAHALEHAAVHAGHIELTAQLWRQKEL